MLSFLVVHIICLCAFAVPGYVVAFNFSQQSNNSKLWAPGPTGFVALKAAPCLRLKGLSKLSLKTLSRVDRTKELTGAGAALLLLQGKHGPKHCS